MMELFGWKIFRKFLFNITKKCVVSVKVRCNVCDGPRVHNTVHVYTALYTCTQHPTCK